MSETEVIPVSVARAQLTTSLKRFREHADAGPIVFGAHSRPEAAIVPYRLLAASVARGSIRDTLHEFAPTIERLARASHLCEVQVFGSVSRGEARDDSDVDLLVSAAPEASYFDIAQFSTDVERLLGRRIDVVTRQGIDPKSAIGRRILAEATAL